MILLHVGCLRRLGRLAAAVRGRVVGRCLAVAMLALSWFPAVVHADDMGLDLEQYRGSVVYVDFWASWCVPCRASFPWMNALHKELSDEGLVILGVNTGDSPEEAARFLERTPARFNIITDADGAMAMSHGLKGMPMAYVYNREGELVASHIGFNERSSVERADAIRELVRR